MDVIKPTTLLLIRHALHDHPPDVLCGRLGGVRLSAAGHDQLPAVAQSASGAEVVACSPQLRCVETALVLSPDIVIDGGLDEIDFGAWMGRPFAELEGNAQWRAWNTDRDRGQCPGGESAAGVRRRAVAAIGAIAARHAGSTIAVVTHADIIRSIMAHYTGRSLQDYGNVDVPQASVRTLVLQGEPA